MKPSDDIRDLLGRYAVGPLTSAERERLFDAALSDQDLFEELAREQELKMLLDQPGARDRMIRTLNAPTRRNAWILSAAVAAALSVVLVAFLMRPRPQQIAVATIPPPVEVAQTAPAPAPPSKAKAIVPAPVPPSPGANKKETDQVQVAAAAPVAPRAQQFAPIKQQQQTAGGPRQLAAQGQGVTGGAVAEQKTGAFAFHYSLDTKGHLVIVPAADGYLFVKAGDGTVLFDRKQIAAAITTNITLPAALKSVTIVFSTDAVPAESAPADRAASSGDVEGSSPLAIQLKTNP